VVFRNLPEQPDWPLPADYRPLFPQLLTVRAPLPFGLALAGLVLCYRRSAPNPLAALTLLARPEVIRALNACRAALKISNEELDLMDGCMQVARVLDPFPPTVARMKRFLAMPASDSARRLLFAIGRSDPTLLERAEWLSGHLRQIGNQGDVAPPPLITGDDLTAAGLQPGPLFKRILDAVYNEQLEGRISSKDKALEMVLGLAQGQ
jgi:hypothetical protein